MSSEDAWPSVDALLDQATQREGCADWGSDTTFVENLRRLLDACRDAASLSVFGRAVLERTAIRHLRNRLAVEAYLSACPGAGAVPEKKAIVITGLPRTGTTLFHNILAADPRHGTLRLWQALRPVPAASEAERRERVERAGAWLDGFYEAVPAFRAIHALKPDGPEECDALLQNSFASQHFADMFGAPHYSAWLEQAPLWAEYRHYARQLRVLESDIEKDAERWVLKSPSHLGHLDALRDALGDPLVVVCHRDPPEAVGSYASLVRTLRTPYCERLSPDEIGREVLERCTQATTRFLRTRRQAGGEGFLDVSYRRLVAEPIAATEELYQQAGLELTAEQRKAIEATIVAHPRHAHGRHDYHLAEFGLTAEQVEDALADYLEEFSSLATDRG